MVRPPLNPEQIAAGKRLGAYLREARGDRRPAAVAEAAAISPETLRKIETGRMVTPAFTTVVALAAALDIPLDDLAHICRPGATQSTSRSQRGRTREAAGVERSQGTAA